MKDKNDNLNILIIPYLIPYPANDGGRICSFSFIDKLKDRINFTVVFFYYNAEEEKNIGTLRILWKSVDIKAINGNAQPKSTQINNPSRFSEILKRILKRLIKPISYQDPIDMLDDHTVTSPFQPRSRKDIEELNSYIIEKKFDIIQLDYTDNLNLVNLLPKNTIKVFVEIESRYSVLGDFINLKPYFEAFNDYIINHTKTLELAFLSKFDAIFALSENDRLRIQQILPNHKIYSSPFSVPDDQISQLKFDNKLLKKLVFIGPEAHFPNKDAAEWFINEVMSKKAISLPLHIVGNWSDETIAKYAWNQNIIFSGFIEDLNDYLTESIMMVPIRLGGGGLRTKILTAMAQGVPIISTTIGIDGFNFTNRTHFLLANQPDEFEEQINYLINHPEACYQIALNAQNLFKSEYSQDRTAEIRYQIYQELALIKS